MSYACGGVTAWTAFFVVWLREQEKTIAWLREIDMREIKKQMMMDDGVEMNEKLRDCVEMKKILDNPLEDLL